MPGGWPIGESEREACARALLASGGDFERIYEASELGVKAYVRHMIRVPFFRLAQEYPIVLVTGKIQSVVALLDFYTRLFELTDQFNQASWLVYLPRHRLGDFLVNAKSWGDVEQVGQEMFYWYTSPSAMLVITAGSKVSDLGAAVAGLELSPESGVIALTNPATEGSTQSSAATCSTPDAPSGSSSSSIARLQIKREPSLFNLPAGGAQLRSPTPPSNPRIRRNTG